MARAYSQGLSRIDFDREMRLDLDHPYGREFDRLWVAVPRPAAALHAGDLCYLDLCGQEDGVAASAVPRGGIYEGYTAGYVPGIDFTPSDAVDCGSGHLNLNNGCWGFADFCKDASSAYTVWAKRDGSDQQGQVWTNGNNAFWNSAGGTVGILSGTVPSGEPTTLAWRTLFGTGVRSWQEGVYFQQSASVTADTFTTTPMSIGARFNGYPSVSGGMDGKIFAVGIGAHPGSDEVAAWASAGAWPEAIWQRRRNYFIPAAGGDITTDVPAGGISLAGQAPTALRDYVSNLPAA